MRVIPSRWLAFERPLMDLEEEFLEVQETMADHADLPARLAEIEARRRQLVTEVYADLTPHQRVQLARHPRRPYTLDFVERMFDDFVELHGDRRHGDDRAFVTGPALLDGRTVMVIGHQKGRDTRERKERNFAQGRPEGYRKALRMMEMAENMRMPVICLIDTPAADCLAEAETRGISQAIAEGQMRMSTLRVPIIIAVIGEGGSGGAIGIGVGDVVLMMENAIYSVIPPEGYASIVWRDAARVAEASEQAKITAHDALALGVIDEILPEPPGGAHADPDAAAATLKARLRHHLPVLDEHPVADLLDRRYAKYRAMGIYGEGPTVVA